MRVAQVRDERTALGAVRAVGRGQRERREVAAGRRRQGRRDESVARAVGVAVQELVLLERQARVHVDEAVDAADPRIGGDPSRVVEQARQVVGAGRRAVGADRDGDRRERALPELALEAIERGARRDAGRQDAGVRGVEPDMQERRAEQEQQGERRDEDRDRPAHDAAREARPRAVALGSGRDAAHGEPIEVRADHREQGRQQRQRREDRQADDQRPGDPDAAQDHELEEDEPEQPQQHGQAAEEHGAAGGRDGDPDGLGDSVVACAGRVARPAPPGTGWS